MRGFNELLLHPVEIDVTEEKGNSKSIIEIDSRMNMLTGVKLRWPRITRIKIVKAAGISKFESVGIDVLRLEEGNLT